jgi:hypothetical protein
MLPFGGFPLPYGSTPGITRGGKSHSGISGSKAACAYPELIAACHALRQRPSRAIRQAAYHAEPFRNPHSNRSERGSHQGPAPWAIGDRGLNVSTEVSTRTPRFHQPHLLWEPSSSPKPLSPVVQSGPERLPIFGRGFRLRCFQPLSSIAWRPGSALSDNR